VLATERALGRDPRVQAYNNPGYDILSLPTDDGPSIRIEVKARLEGAEDFYVTHNEVVTGLNAAPNYRLVLVTISKTGARDQVRYLSAPSSGADFGGIAATGIRLNWMKMWHASTEPF
jgi:Protein NO VEIN, C-terminal